MVTPPEDAAQDPLASTAVDPVESFMDGFRLALDSRRQSVPRDPREWGGLRYFFWGMPSERVVDFVLGAVAGGVIGNRTDAMVVAAVRRWWPRSKVSNKPAQYGYFELLHMTLSGTTIHSSEVRLTEALDCLAKANVIDFCETKDLVPPEIETLEVGPWYSMMGPDFRFLRAYVISSASPSFFAQVSVPSDSTHYGMCGIEVSLARSSIRWRDESA